MRLKYFRATYLSLILVRHQSRKSPQSGEKHKATERPITRENDPPSATGKTARVKEVWFKGSHSDMCVLHCSSCFMVCLISGLSGGGNVSNAQLNNATIPVLWIGNEALMAGLKLKPSRVEWDWRKLKYSGPTKSLGVVWYLFEALPFKRLTYKDEKSTTW